MARKRKFLSTFSILMFTYVHLTPYTDGLGQTLDIILY